VRDECVDHDNASSAGDLLPSVRSVTVAATATEYSFILYVEILTIGGGHISLTPLAVTVVIWTKTETVFV